MGYKRNDHGCIGQIAIIVVDADIFIFTLASTLHTTLLILSSMILRRSM